MNDPRPAAWLPALGCLSLVIVLIFLCLMPFLLVDLMRAALERLHLSPEGALAAVLGIFLGSLVNLPIHRLPRRQPPAATIGGLGIWTWPPQPERLRPDTVIAVNLGGCVVPLGLALWQVRHLFAAGGWPLAALIFVAALNILVCYRTSRPIHGIGVMMPVFVSPLTAVLATWLLLMNPEFAAQRAPVAFVAGVLGPIVGADLLRLRDISRASVGMLSIGGAGTFDGIVVSGVLAALLA